MIWTSDLNIIHSISEGEYNQNSNDIISEGGLLIGNLALKVIPPIGST